MRRTAALRAVLATVVASGSIVFAATAPPATAATGGTIDPVLAAQMASAGADAVLPVAVHAGGSLTDAKAAVSAAGLTLVGVWDSIGVAVAAGTPARIKSALEEPGVTYLEGDRAVAFDLDTSHIATRGKLAQDTFSDLAGRPIKGTGVSIAVVDSGIDGTHPFFLDAEGESKVVRNLKNICHNVLNPPADPSLADACFIDHTAVNDTDTEAAGGHGTHVAGIAAGYPTTTVSPRVVTLQGAAADAKLVGIAVGASLSVFGGNHGLNWVANHHAAPCGAGVSAVDCPPIRVVNNSYGPVGGGSFSPTSSTTLIQRSLVAKGVLVTWAAGNDGGTGNEAARRTNPPGQDPTPGIVMVANYDDVNTGTRDGALDSGSSRGRKTDHGSYPDISAPGSGITSSCRPALSVCATGIDPVDGPGENDIGTFNTIGGTSMAAPHIAGIAAQLFQANPALTPGDVELLLEATAYKFGQQSSYEADPLHAGKTTSFDKGHGLVNAAAAVARIFAATEPTLAVTQCPADAAFTDPTGDSGTPPNSSLDIVGSRLSTQAAAERVTFHLSVADLQPATQGATQGYIYRFTYGSKQYYVEANRSVDGTSFFFGDFLGSGGSRRAYPAEMTGTFDDATNQITIVLEFAAPLVAIPPAAKIKLGDLFSGLGPSSGQQIGHPDVGSVTPTADSATGPCSYTVGAVAAEPVVPEVPVGVILPLLALTLLGGGFQLARRRSAA